MVKIKSNYEILSLINSQIDDARFLLRNMEKGISYHGRTPEMIYYHLQKLIKLRAQTS